MSFYFVFCIRNWFCLLILIFVSASANAQNSQTVRVMSFNLWHGGDAGKQPLSQTLAVIKAGQADMVGIQEGEGTAPRGEPRPDNAAKLAKELGWNYFAQNGRTGIISRFSMVGNTPGKHGVKLELSPGVQIYVFNVHLNHSPYQPYQLLSIPYDNGAFLTTANEAIKAAHEARGHEIDAVLDEIKSVASEGLPIFLTGDFNEPCCHDWTSQVTDAKLCPIEVCWPTTQAVVKAGFVDTYRQLHPDPTKHRGLTWTPLTKLDDPADRHDRIDFVFLKSSNAKINSVKIVGESGEFADIVVTPYPSDHRAVVAEVVIGSSSSSSE